MYNILITGGAGYIGSELINKLISLEQYNITVIDKMIFGQNSLNEFLKEKIYIDKRGCEKFSGYKKSLYQVAIL